ncbi:MAG: hypothetical protein BWY85_00010 [Firmicutes bacterium ADurb.Bin506]|nr:MAG: hypothetical protein BWY85_00010 [Firmicutes bacterium ADurb.Bin506]
MKRTDPVILAALRNLVRDGKLDPQDVVEAARNADSPLHDHFTWDDTEAAHQFRLQEARKLITVHFELLPTSPTPSQVFISLRSDQARGGGYRTTVAVLSDKAMRRELLQQAMDDMEHFSRKYGALVELAGVIREMQKLRKPKRAPRRS